MLNFKESGLFLDDKRNPFDVTWIELPQIPFFVIRSYNEFVTHILKNGLPKFISFDCDLHDEHYPWHPITVDYYRNGLIPYHLYKEKTGRDCAIWLTEYCCKKKQAVPPYAVHSMNAVAREHVKEILDIYEKTLKLSAEQLEELRQLENKIFETGIDGGILTSDAIDSLYAKEKEFGVFTTHRPKIRWLDL